MAQKGRSAQVNKSTNIDYDKLSAAVKRGIIEAEQEQKPKVNETLKAARKVSAFKLMFAKKSEICSSNGTSVFLQLCMISIIGIVQILLVLLVASSLYAIYVTWFNLFNTIISLCVAVVAFLLFGLMRVMKIEIEKEQDRKYLLSLSASFASIFALIVAVISLFIRR